jgi:hypothetical protein
LPIRKADLEIPPTTGLSGALSSFIDIANGAYAYSEVVGDPFELPLYGDSSQTTYRIAAVGLGKMLGVGLQPGDENQLTADEIAEARLVRLRAAVFDVILPLATSVVLPRLTYGGWKSIFEQPSNLELFADYINLVNQMPGLKEAIDSGSLGEIVNVAWGYINPATGSKTFQSATVSAVSRGVGPGQFPLPKDVGNFINDTEPACSRFSASFLNRRGSPILPCKTHSFDKIPRALLKPSHRLRNPTNSW